MNSSPVRKLQGYSKVYFVHENPNFVKQNKCFIQISEIQGNNSMPFLIKP
jgi:hypothetical protein